MFAGADRQRPDLYIFLLPWNLLNSCYLFLYREFEDETETLNQLDEAFTGHKQYKVIPSETTHKCLVVTQRMRERLWEFLENPSSSLFAKVENQLHVLTCIYWPSEASHSMC